MQVRLLQQVLLKGKLNTFRQLYKEFESEIKPNKGDKVYDTAWKDPDEYEVTEVAIDFNHDTCYVWLPMIEIESDDVTRVKEYIKMAKLHDWKCDVE